MPLLKFSNPFDEDLDKATNENNTEEDWGSILNICDNVDKIPDGSKLCINAIKRRLHNSIPFVVLQTLTVLDSCVNNCKQSFKLELASKEFITELKNLASKGSHYKIMDKSRELIKKWAHEFKEDPALFQIPALYHQLLRDGIDFPTANLKVQKSLKTKNPNFVESKEEEEDIAKAIHLSLKESKYNVNQNHQNAHLVKPDVIKVNYPQTEPIYSDPNTSNDSKKLTNYVTAKALYDFEAVEDNEISFKAEDELLVSDSTDVNWWKGRIVGSYKEGLFPATFVTLLRRNETTSKTTTTINNDNLKFNEIKSCPDETETIYNGYHEEEIVEDFRPYIDENVLDQCLNHLHLADPTGKISDPSRMLVTETRSLAMSSLIDQELEKVDDCHSKLFELNRKLNEAFRFYNYLLNNVATVPNQPPYQTPIPLPLYHEGYYPQPHPFPQTTNTNIGPVSCPEGQLNTNNFQNFQPIQQQQQQTTITSFPINYPNSNQPPQQTYNATLHLPQNQNVNQQLYGPQMNAFNAVPPQPLLNDKIGMMIPNNNNNNNFPNYGNANIRQDHAASNMVVANEEISTSNNNQIIIGRNSNETNYVNNLGPNAQEFSNFAPFTSINNNQNNNYT